MAECYTDYYTDKSKILTLLEHGTPKEREIVLGSLVIHYEKENHFDLTWRIFLSDEHITVREHALSVASNFATTKQLFEMVDYILDKDHERRDLLFSARLLRVIQHRYQDGKLK